MNFDEAAPTRYLVKQHYFSFGGCERNGMNFDEAAPTRYLVKRHYFSFGVCERNGMNFDEAARTTTPQSASQTGRIVK